MNTIIGQKKLLSELKLYNFVTAPPAALLLGEAGSGKHYIAERFAKHLGVELVELTDHTSVEELIDYRQSPVARLYLIELAEVTEKAQNKFLKFIEEPSPTIRVLLTAESDLNVLPTIKNRCKIFRMEAYTTEELKQFSWAPTTSNPLVYKICTTPGQLLKLTDAEALSKIQKLCQTILQRAPKLPQSSYANFMGICTTINCKEDFTKFDLILFLKVLLYEAFETFTKTQDMFCFEVYRLTMSEYKHFLDKTPLKENFILSFLNKIWGLTTHESR